jgi:C4-type Zn-finger protein
MKVKREEIRCPSCWEVVKFDEKEAREVAPHFPRRFLQLCKCGHMVRFQEDINGNN